MTRHKKGSNKKPHNCHFSNNKFVIKQTTKQLWIINKKRTAKVIKCSIDDLKTVQNKLETINKETCTDKMLHIIDEACDSIDMALRFLEHIDTDYFTSNHNGEGITFGVK